MKAQISVVIPVYRSQEIVEPLCRALLTALSSLRHEIILVDDCSPDDSWAVIKSVAAQHEQIRGIHLRRNAGQDRAIMAGLNFAMGDYVVIMDDDLQHDPEDIPRLYQKITEGYDVCYANYRKKRQKLYKNFGSYLAGKVAQRVLSKPNHIYMSPFKIIRREVTDRIVAYKGPFPYIDGLIFQITGNITQITVEHHRRYAGESTHNIWKQLPVFLTLTTNYSILPLRAMAIFGLICSLISFFLGIYFLCVYFWVGIKVYGWTALALINLFIGGTVLMSLGFIGEYIGRVLMNVNGVPQYVIEETVNTAIDKNENRSVVG